MLPYVIADDLRERGNCDTAVPLYEWSFQLAPSTKGRQLGLAVCLFAMQRLDEAEAVTLDALRHGARYRDAVLVLRAVAAARDSLVVRAARGDSAVLAGSNRQ